VAPHAGSAVPGHHQPAPHAAAATPSAAGHIPPPPAHHLAPQGPAHLGHEHNFRLSPAAEQPAVSSFGAPEPHTVPLVDHAARGVESVPVLGELFSAGVAVGGVAAGVAGDVASTVADMGNILVSGMTGGVKSAVHIGEEAVQGVEHLVP
jgi:hypothetical protein